MQRKMSEIQYCKSHDRGSIRAQIMKLQHRKASQYFTNLETLKVDALNRNFQSMEKKMGNDFRKK